MGVCVAACWAALCLCRVWPCAKPIQMNRLALNPHVSYDTSPIPQSYLGHVCEELWDEWPRNSALVAQMMQRKKANKNHSRAARSGAIATVLTAHDPRETRVVGYGTS